jgi:hypothetical protein
MPPNQSPEPLDTPDNVEDLVPYSTARVDWEKIAVMLANGRRMNEIAGAMGCTRQTIWRALRRSPKLVERVREERARIEAETGSMMDGLRILIANGLVRRIHEGDIRVMLWLAGRLGIGRSHYAKGTVLSNPPAEIDAAVLETDIARKLAEFVDVDLFDRDSTDPQIRTRAPAPIKNMVHRLKAAKKP